MPMEVACALQMECPCRPMAGRKQCIGKASAINPISQNTKQQERGGRESANYELKKKDCLHSLSSCIRLRGWG